MALSKLFQNILPQKEQADKAVPNASTIKSSFLKNVFKTALLSSLAVGALADKTFTKVQAQEVSGLAFASNASSTSDSNDSDSSIASATSNESGPINSVKYTDILEKRILASKEYTLNRGIAVVDGEFFINFRGTDSDSGQKFISEYSDLTIANKESVDPILALLKEAYSDCDECNFAPTSYYSNKNNSNEFIKSLDKGATWGASKQQIYYDMAISESLITPFVNDAKGVGNYDEKSNLTDRRNAFNEYYSKYLETASESDIDLDKDLKTAEAILLLESLSSKVEQYKPTDSATDEQKANKTNESEVKDLFKDKGQEYFQKVVASTNIIKARIALFEQGKYAREDLMINLQFLQRLARWTYVINTNTETKELMQSSVDKVGQALAQVIQPVMKKGFEAAIKPTYQKASTAEQYASVPYLMLYTGLSRQIAENSSILRDDVSLATIPQDVQDAKVVAEHFLKNEYTAAKLNSEFTTLLASESAKVEGFDVAALENKELDSKVPMKLATLRTNILRDGLTPEYAAEFRTLRTRAENIKDKVILAAIEEVNRQGLVERASVVGNAKLVMVPTNHEVRYTDEKGVWHSGKVQPMAEWTIQAEPRNKNPWQIEYVPVLKDEVTQAQLDLGSTILPAAKLISSDKWEDGVADLPVQKLRTPWNELTQEATRPKPLLFAQYKQLESTVRLSDLPEATVKVSEVPKAPAEAVPSYMAGIAAAMNQKYGVLVSYAKPEKTRVGIHKKPVDANDADTQVASSAVGIEKPKVKPKPTTEVTAE